MTISTTKIQGATLAFILFCSGAWGLGSMISLEQRGIRTTAQIVGSVTECEAEFQVIGQERQRQPMPCETAEGLQKVAGSNKVEVHKEFYTLVKFEAADGSIHEERIKTYKLPTGNKEPGTAIPVVYDPGSPSDVGPQLSWESAKIGVGLTLAGLVIAALVFLGPLSRLLGGLLGSSPNREPETSSAWTGAAVEKALARPAMQVVQSTSPNSRNANAGRAQFGVRR